MNKVLRYTCTALNTAGSTVPSWNNFVKKYGITQEQQE